MKRAHICIWMSVCITWTLRYLFNLSDVYVCEIRARQHVDIHKGHWNDRWSCRCWAVNTDGETRIKSERLTQARFPHLAKESRKKLAWNRKRKNSTIKWREFLSQLLKVRCLPVFSTILVLYLFCGNAPLIKTCLMLMVKCLNLIRKHSQPTQKSNSTRLKCLTLHFPLGNL